MKIIERVFEWYEMSIFGKLIYHYQDSIKIVELRQPLNEMEANHLPSIIKYRETLEQT